MTTIDDTAELPVALEPQPRPRVRGLAIRSLPTWPNAMQWAGGGAALAGVYLAWGLAVTLIVGGLGAAVLGMLKEGGKI